MPIVNNAGNKQMNGHKMQIKDGNHGNLPRVTSPFPPVTLISQWRIKTQGEQQGLQETKRQAGGGNQQAKEWQSNSKQTTRANLRGDDSNTHAQSERLLANRTSPS